MPQPNSKKASSAVPESGVVDANSPGSAARSKSRTERRAELFDQRRAERKKAPAKQRRDRLITRIVAGTIAALIVAGLAYGIVTWIQDRENRQRPDGVVTYAYAGGEHTVDTVSYSESPPVGGPHDAVWQTCNFYDGVIRSENAVHSLEHGVVWVTYRPDISEDEKSRLEDLSRGDRYMLVSAYPDQESPIVATAWNNQLTIESADDQELRQFVNYFRQGPQAPEPGATCEGGTTAIIG
ncbi:DUF3105 domain-containing protein [soil metagenome]